MRNRANCVSFRLVSAAALILAGRAGAQSATAANADQQPPFEAPLIRADAVLDSDLADLKTQTPRGVIDEPASPQADSEPLDICNVTQVFCPTCETFSMFDWMTLDTDLRDAYHMDGSHFMTQVVWPGKMWNLKTSNGDTWDSLLIDNNYIYQYLTEVNWHQPTDYKRAYLNTNVIWTPRLAHGGFPGTRVVSCDTRWVTAVDCVEGEPWYLGGPGAFIINEVRGPYTLVTGGNIGIQTVIKVLYYWDCPDGEYPWHCGWVETNWYARRYGLIRWAKFRIDSEGNNILVQESNFFNLVAGGWQSPVFPCY